MTRKDTVSSSKAVPRLRPRASSIQVIARAASVLRALEGEDTGLSLGQIAQRVGLARSTVQRIVDALNAEQFLIAASPTAGVRLGPALIRLAASARIDFDQIVRPIIVELSKKVGETVDVSVMKGNRAVFTDQVQGAHRLRAVSAIGETFPLHCTANGKALLSLLDDDKLRRIVRSPLEKLTMHTITRPAEILAQVSACRRSGIAFDEEEHTDGICAVGTALLDPVGRSLALSIPVPTSRFRKLRPELVRRLLGTRAKLLETMGRPIDE